MGELLALLVWLVCLVGMGIGVARLLLAAYRIVEVDRERQGRQRLRRVASLSADLPLWAREHLALDDPDRDLALRHPDGECAWCDAASKGHPVAIPQPPMPASPLNYEKVSATDVARELEREFDELMKRWGHALWVTRHCDLDRPGYMSGSRPRPLIRVMPTELHANPGTAKEGI